MKVGGRAEGRRANGGRGNGTPAANVRARGANATCIRCSALNARHKIPTFWSVDLTPSIRRFQRCFQVLWPPRVAHGIPEARSAEAMEQLNRLSKRLSSLTGNVNQGPENEDQQVAKGDA